MRPVTIMVLLLIAGLIGHILYQRAQVDNILNAALKELPAHPLAAWAKAQSVDDLSGILTFGKNAAAEKTFVDELQRGVLHDVEMSPPKEEAVGEATEALEVCKRVTQKTALNTDGARAEIVRAMHTAAPSLQNMGTLEAWDKTLLFFQTVSADNAWPPGLVTDPNAFVAQLEAFPRRTVALRDCAMRAAAGLVQGLGQVGLAYDSGGKALAGEMPLNVPDDRLYTADKALTQALGDLDSFDGIYPDNKQPPELNALRASILFDRAAIKIGHYQEKGDSLMSSYDGYLTKLWVRTDTLSTPEPAILLGMLKTSATDDLQRASALYAAAPTLPREKRDAYRQAADNTLGLLNNARPANPNSIYPAGVDESGAVKSTHGLELMTRTNSRVLLLTYSP